MSGSLSTFWVYLQEILENTIPPESPVRGELNELLQSFAKNPIADQHEQARRLFEIMAELPLGHELAKQRKYFSPPPFFLHFVVNSH